MKAIKFTFCIFVFIIANMLMFTAKAHTNDDISSNSKQLELLVNKIWFQIDENNGNRLNEEHYYTLSGEHTVTIMHANRNLNFPVIEENKFYLSDTIVSHFDKSKRSTQNNGNYFVIEKKVNDKTQTYCYKIEELTEQLLVISRVLPTEESRKVFVVKSLLTTPNAKNKSVKDMLIGKQWLPKPGMESNPHKTFGRMRGMLYFTEESLKTDITKTHSGGGYTESQESKYRLETHSDMNKKNATHIVTDIKYGTSTDHLRIGTFEILYISDNMLILQNTGLYTFGNNRKPQPLEKYVYVNE